MTKEKTVYVLGAGFSRNANYPITEQFTSEKTIKNVLEKLIKKSDIKKLNKVSDYFLDRINSKYCENIEDVLNHVTVGEYLGMESKTEGKRPYPSEQIFHDLFWYVGKVLETVEEKIHPQYLYFAKHVLKTDATIISFNYDLLLEHVFEKLSISPNYGIFKNPPKNSQLILKIHGSANWTYCDNCNEFSRFSGYEISNVLENKTKCEECGLKLEPVLIPPILYKELYYKHPTQEKLVRYLWNHTYEELSKAKKIVFIGFSMNPSDSYAKELFKFASNSNRTPGLTYLVISKSKEKKRVEELQDRFYSVLVGENIEFDQLPFTKFVEKYISS